MANYDYTGQENKYGHLTENSTDFEIGDIIQKGWELFQRDWANVLGFMLTLVVIVVLGICIPLLGWLALFIYAPVLSASHFILMDKINKGEDYTYRSILEECATSLRELWIASFLVAILTSIGFMFFFFPGIYLAVAYQFTIPLIIFGKLDAWTAMETSRKIISQNWGRFFILILATVIISFFCALIPIIGNFLALGLSLGMQYVLFREVTGEPETILEQKINDIGVPPQDAWK